MAPESITRDEDVPFTDLKRYVRVRQVVDDKFIEFDFAIGDPSLYVELVLPRTAFEVFCKHNRVEMMTDEQAAAVDADMEKWRYGDDRANP
ncbi:phenol hydroxylase [Seongchinamella unica]|uniref:Phenol hydroxylase n=1 Tax=Seongchinamella unica TaxID=2547392 RepID=A0A4R5LTI7_9GAMM|nr:phenol hydroxylase subunit [Seongchinamella unica]TDG14067.1 phenol hydroxylase [Seongchinamella unica]